MTHNQTTISQVLRQAATELENSDTPALDCRLLMQFALNKSAIDLMADQKEIMQADQIERFYVLLKQRIQGMPIAYIIGQKEFWSLTLKVTQDVLVPRPDTETLVEVVLDYIATHKSSKRSLKILDLGTGSGAIALALAHELPHAEVYAVDKSEKALAVAEDNRQALGLNNLTLLCSDWFAQINSQTFDVIVSNPPYIDKNDVHLADDGVRFEPMQALIADDNGLKDIDSILAQAGGFLEAEAGIFIEHGYQQANQVSDLFRQYGFESVSSYRDLQQHERVTGAIRCL